MKYSFVILTFLIGSHCFGKSEEVKTNARKPASGSYYCNSFKKFNSEELDAIASRIAGACKTDLPHALIKTYEDGAGKTFLYCCTAP